MGRHLTGVAVKPRAQMSRKPSFLHLAQMTRPAVPVEQRHFIQKQKIDSPPDYQNSFWVPEDSGHITLWDYANHAGCKDPLPGAGHFNSTCRVEAHKKSGGPARLQIRRASTAAIAKIYFFRLVQILL